MLSWKQTYLDNSNNLPKLICEFQVDVALQWLILIICKGDQTWNSHIHLGYLLDSFWSACFHCSVKIFADLAEIGELCSVYVHLNDTAARLQEHFSWRLRVYFYYAPSPPSTYIFAQHFLLHNLMMRWGSRSLHVWRKKVSHLHFDALITS